MAFRTVSRLRKPAPTDSRHPKPKRPRNRAKVRLFRGRPPAVVCTMAEGEEFRLVRLQAPARLAFAWFRSDGRIFDRGLGRFAHGGWMPRPTALRLRRELRHPWKHTIAWQRGEFNRRMSEESK